MVQSEDRIALAICGDLRAAVRAVLRDDRGDAAEPGGDERQASGTP